MISLICAPFVDIIYIHLAAGCSQGVWRMQPLPGCAPAGESAMRLTYAVEVSPRPYLPVALVERRIAADLCNNLIAIREHLAGSK
jgi:hypothetical protein